MADTVRIPKKPNLDIMKMLIKANNFIEHARQHSILNNEFDIMISIHNLDNAIEYMLRIIVDHLEIEELSNKTINASELSQLIGEIQKFLKDNSAPTLSYVKEIKRIRELRNMVQHALILPISELGYYLDIGLKFFDKSLEKYFGVSRGEIRYSSLIKNDHVKKQLKLAEDKIDSKRYLEAIVACRDAFDYANFLYNKDTTFKLNKAPALSEIKDKSLYLYHFLRNIYERVSIDCLNIDTKKYLHYQDYLSYIPKEYQHDWSGNSVLQRDWEKRDADFCYNFVASTVLQWEISIMPSINEIKRDGSEVEYDFVDKINGIDLENVFISSGCSYFYSHNRYGRLFYMDKKNIVRMKKELKNEYIEKEVINYVNKEKEMHYVGIGKILNYDVNIIMHNPPTWEIMLFYDLVPFTRQDYIKTEHVEKDKINLDKCTKDILLERGVDDKVCNTIINFIKKHGVIDSYNKAVELDELLYKHKGYDVYKFFSPNLVKSLSVKKVKPV